MGLRTVCPFPSNGARDRQTFSIEFLPFAFPWSAFFSPRGRKLGFFERFGFAFFSRLLSESFPLRLNEGFFLRAFYFALFSSPERMFLFSSVLLSVLLVSRAKVFFFVRMKVSFFERFAPRPSHLLGEGFLLRLNEGFFLRAICFAVLLVS